MNIIQLREVPFLPPVEGKFPNGLTPDTPWKRTGAALKGAMLQLQVSNVELAKAVASLPVPDRYGREGMARYKVNESNVSMWLRGKEKPTVARLAGMVAIVELFLIYYKARADATPDADPFVLQRIDLAWGHHRVAVKLPELAPWLKFYRRGISARLQKDKKKTEYDTFLHTAYTEALKPVLDLYEEEDKEEEGK